MQHAYGAVKDSEDTRDYLLAAPKDIVLPPAVDLVSFCSPVRNQGQQGSCTGFALVTGLMEFLRNKVGAPFVLLSPAFAYYMERKLEKSTHNCDAGAMIRDGLKVLAKTGVCPEADDPYTDQRCGHPSAAATHAAGEYKITQYTRLLSVTDFKAALVNGHGIVVGIAVYPSFEALKPGDGHVPLPAKGEQMLGGHALFGCGYIDDAAFPGGGYGVFKNSWGPEFGDAGYVYLPYDYLSDPNLTFDMWSAF